MARTAQFKRARMSPREVDALPLKARRHPLVAVIARELKRCGVGGRPARPTDRLIIGVSGGADSTALLLGCAAISGRRNAAEAFVEPIAVHVHHHLRSSADDDAQMVSDLCDRLGIELHVRHVNPRPLNGNISANARKLRYAAMVDVAMSREAQFIAVAHHAEDQLETVLMALCRGAGMHGLAAMVPARLLGEDLTLVRPLLRVRKSECENLCRAAGVKWADDPTNTDVNQVRARLRRDVVPVLEELWPGAATRASAATDMANIASAGLERWLMKVFGDSGQRSWERHAIRGLPPAVIAAALRRAAVEMAAEVVDTLGQNHLLDAAHAIADDVRRPRRFAWPGGLTCVVQSERVSIEREISRVKGKGRKA